MTVPAVDIALTFLVAWPALEYAADMVIRRRLEVDGDLYPVPTPAAETLAGHHPLAAINLLRSMITSPLGGAWSRHCRHAAHSLDRCTGLAAPIDAWTPLQSPIRCVETFRSDYGRKAGVWRRTDHQDGDKAG